MKYRRVGNNSENYFKKNSAEVNKTVKTNLNDLNANIIDT